MWIMILGWQMSPYSPQMDYRQNPTLESLGKKNGPEDNQDLDLDVEGWVQVETFLISDLLFNPYQWKKQSLAVSWQLSRDAALPDYFNLNEPNF